MVQPLTPAELAELQSTQRVDLIDVRDPHEYDAGHIAGARLVPLETFRADPDRHLVHGVPLVFICAKGVRSLAAAKLAERFGYERIYNLEGGTKQWAAGGGELRVVARVAA